MVKDKKCIIVAGGNSLRSFDFNSLVTDGVNKLPIFAINESFPELVKRGITPDYWTFWDEPIRKRRESIMDEFFEKGKSINTIDIYNLGKYTEWKIDREPNNEPKISRKPGHVGNMNSGLAFAINVALQNGFNHIYLLGADNRIIGTQLHWYDEAPVPIERKKRYESGFQLFDRFMRKIVSDLKPHEFIVGVETGFTCIAKAKKVDFIQWMSKQ